MFNYSCRMSHIAWFTTILLFIGALTGAIYGVYRIVAWLNKKANYTREEIDGKLLLVASKEGCLLRKETCGLSFDTIISNQEKYHKETGDKFDSLVNNISTMLVEIAIVKDRTNK